MSALREQTAHKQTIVKAEPDTLFQTYGRDGAGIEYLHPKGTKAVRIERTLVHGASEWVGYTCDCKRLACDTSTAWWLVQTATGSRHYSEGPTYVTHAQHKSFDCAVRHLNRIHVS